jgi:hypothetical protein
VQSRGYKLHVKTAPAVLGQGADGPRGLEGVLSVIPEGLLDRITSKRRPKTVESKADLGVVVDPPFQGGAAGIGTWPSEEQIQEFLDQHSEHQEPENAPQQEEPDPAAEVAAVPTPSEPDNEGQAGTSSPQERCREAALLAHSLGFSPLPPRLDGTKEPITNWKPYQTRQPTLDQIEAWYGAGNTGHGLVTGQANLECMEWEEVCTYEEFLNTARAAGLGELASRIAAGYCEASAGGGIHWLWICSACSGNTVLARRLKTPDEFTEKERARVAQNPNFQPTKVRIETRGKGGYIVTAPSCGAVHPSGRPYVLQTGGLKSIVTITPEEREALFEIARSFNLVPEHEVRYRPRGRPATHNGQLRPGDDYNLRGDWHDLLTRLEWTYCYTRADGVELWRRPGKDRGVSATLGYCGDKLYVFSSNAYPLKERAAHDKFSVLTRSEHHGNYSAAAKALAAQGYGSQHARNGRQVVACSNGQHEAACNHAQPGISGPTGPDNFASPRRIHFEESTTLDTDSSDSSDSSKAGEDSSPSFSSSHTFASSTSSIAEWHCVSEPASKRTVKPVEFLDGGLLPRGKLVLIAGQGGAGKGVLVTGLVADLTQGRATLGLDYTPPNPISVLLIGCEEGYEDAVGPRLMAGGADLERVRLMAGVRDPQGRMLPFSLAHIELLGRHLADLPQIRLVIIDPITGYVGRAGIKDHYDADLRAVLEPLAELADQRQVTIVAIKHLNKDEAKSTMGRVGGSVSYVNVPRACYIVGPLPTDPDARALAVFKWNLNTPWPPTVAWTIRTPPPEAVQSIRTNHCGQLAAEQWEKLSQQLRQVVWKGQVDYTAEDLLACAASPKRPHQKSRIEKAQKWLAERLAGGPVGSLVCAKEGSEAIGEAWPDTTHDNPETARRKIMGRVKWWREIVLKKGLGGEARKHGYPGLWFFCLPNNEQWPPSQESIHAAQFAQSKDEESHEESEESTFLGDREMDSSNGFFVRGEKSQTLPIRPYLAPETRGAPPATDSSMPPF